MAAKLQTNGSTSGHVLGKKIGDLKKQNIWYPGKMRASSFKQQPLTIQKTKKQMEIQIQERAEHF